VDDSATELVRLLQPYGARSVCPVRRDAESIVLFLERWAAGTLDDPGWRPRARTYSVNPLPAG
jgi:hypothetical protein